MKYSLELSRGRRANVWLDEAPPAKFSPSATIMRTVKSKKLVEAVRSIAAVELKIPHGAKASYALLGAELIGSEASGVELILLVNSFGFPFTSSLALKRDEVIVGLLDEYVEAVCAGIINTAEKTGLPTNVAMRFCWAAHGSVGSSSVIFEKVSRLLIQLFSLPKVVTEENLTALFGDA